MDVNRNLILVEFSIVLRLVEFSGILILVESVRLFRYRVDVSRIFRFWFRV